MWLKNYKSKEYNFILYRLQKILTEIKAKLSTLKNIFEKKIRFKFTKDKHGIIKHVVQLIVLRMSVNQTLKNNYIL